jgi:hypothetical protein
MSTLRIQFLKEEIISPDVIRRALEDHPLIQRDVQFRLTVEFSRNFPSDLTTAQVIRAIADDLERKIKDGMGEHHP